MGLLTRLKRLLAGRGSAREPAAAARAAAAKVQAEALRQQFPRSLPPR